jgi:hypothetical protein
LACVPVLAKQIALSAPARYVPYDAPANVRLERSVWLEEVPKPTADERQEAPVVTAHVSRDEALSLVSHDADGIELGESSRGSSVK